MYHTDQFDITMSGQKHWSEGQELEALRMRQAGLTPQQVCTTLAKFIFNDKGKYNMVKGWYRRTFDDWPSSSQGQQPISIFTTLKEPVGAFGTPLTYSSPLPRPQRSLQQVHNFENRVAPHGNFYPPSFHSQNQAERKSTTCNNGAVTLSPIDQTLLYTNHHDGSKTYRAPYTEGQLADFQNSFEGRVVQPHQYSTLTRYRDHMNMPTKPWHDYAEHPAPTYPQNQPTVPQTDYYQRLIAQSNEGGSPVQNLDGSSSGMVDFGPTTDEGSGTCFPYPDPLDRSELGNLGSMSEDLAFSLNSQSLPVEVFTASKELELPQSQTFNAQSPDQTLQYQNTFTQADIRYSEVQAPSNQRTLNAPPVNQTGTGRTSYKHHRTSSVFGDPSPPPKGPLPPTPLAKQNVLRNRGNGWSLLHVNDQGDVAPVDPNKLPKGPRTKRAKGLASKSHDSLPIYYSKHPAVSSLKEIGSSPMNAEQAATTRGFLSDQSVSPSNTSIHSSLRDSGYISLIDSTVKTVHESLESALSTMKLTGEADDGFVDVEITTKGRMRRSRYIEQMGSTFPLSPES